MSAVESSWNLVARDAIPDRGLYISTFERRLPHGTLVMTLTESGNDIGDPVATSMVFVPAAPHPGQERL